MKTLFKFALLATLVITGKLVKQAAPMTMAQSIEATVTPNPSVVLVHQVLTSEPVKPVRSEQQPQQSGSGLLAEMF